MGIACRPVEAFAGIEFHLARVCRVRVKTHIFRESKETTVRMNPPTPARSVPIKNPKLTRTATSRPGLSRTDGFTALDLIKIALFFVLPFVLANAASFQAQMAILGGHRTIVSNGVVKMALLGLILAAFWLRWTIVPTRMMTITLLFVSYLLLDAVRLYFSVGLAISDVLYGYNTYYTIILVNVIALAVPLRFSERRLTRLLVFTFIVCASIGVAQFVTKRPIVPTSNADGSFNVHGLGLFTSRAFSLFQEPWSFALFSSFALAFFIVRTRRRKGKLRNYVLLLLAITSVGIAEAREVYVGVVGVIISSLFFTFGKRRNRTRWLPLVWLGLGISVSFFAYYLSQIGGRSHSLSDTGSFTMRLKDWSYYLHLLTQNGTGVLFGFGIAQTPNAAAASGIVPIDNMYVATIADIGIVGFIIYMLMAWSLWEQVRRVGETRRSDLATAVAAFFSIYLCSTIFMKGLEPFGTVLLLYTLSEASIFAPLPDSDEAASRNGNAGKFPAGYSQRA